MISINIVVKNDPEIAQTLIALTKVTKSNKIEILVIDASEGSLDYIKNDFSSVKWIRFSPPKSGKITIAEQRNIGIKNSKGNIIVFIDSGCIPQRDWLKNLTNPILEEHEFIVAGSVISEGEKTIHDQIRDTNDKAKYLHECPTINLAFSKEIISKVGYFDENLEHGEDVDFSWRASDLGYKIRYEKNSVVSHNWGNIKQDLIRAFRYGRGRCKIYKKHPLRLKYLFHRDPIVFIYPLFIVGLPITFVFPWFPLLILIPLLKNKQKDPIRVTADHLFYGFGVLYEFFIL